MIRHATRFPLGDTHSIEFEKIEFVEKIFSFLMKEDAPLDDFGNQCNLKDLIKFGIDLQVAITPQQWEEKIRKAVAYHSIHTLFSNYLKPKYLNSFERYINGKINIKCQKILDGDKTHYDLNATDLTDLAFLKKLKKLYHLNDRLKKEAANNIAFTKHLMLDLLPKTFKKVNNTTIGRRIITAEDQDKNNYNPIEVCHYEEGNPAKTRFGYIYEWLCYQFQVKLYSKYF